MASIIVLDDSAVILEVVRAALEAAGHDVRPAVNLSELEVVCAFGPADAFILDLRMPEATGDVVANVLEAKLGAGVPILLFSDAPDEELADLTWGGAIVDFVPKSAGVGELVERLELVLRARQGA